VNSLRNEILGLVSIAANLAYLMNLQFDHIEDLKLNYAVGRCHEFASLTRAYKGEEPVSIQEIKKEVIKAIEKLYKVNLTRMIQSKMLCNARLALMDKANN
jgi:hypothetical protein